MQGPGGVSGDFGSVSDTQDVLIIVVARQYFSMLRQEKGHKPDASPLDLEILLLIKFIATADGNVIDLLSRVGIILVSDKIIINGNLLTENLASSRSRINNTLNRLRWDVVPLGNTDKWNLLRPLLQRSDVRNWTIRTIPPETALFSYVRDNPQVQLQADSMPVFLETARTAPPGGEFAQVADPDGDHQGTMAFS
jgi:hypothetical protein